jgi:hypothetical protein
MEDGAFVSIVVSMEGKNDKSFMYVVVSMEGKKSSLGLSHKQCQSKGRYYHLYWITIHRPYYLKYLKESSPPLLVSCSLQYFRLSP